MKRLPTLVLAGVCLALVSCSTTATATPLGSLHDAGRGNHVTDAFTTRGPWTVVWHYDCSGQRKQGRFALSDGSGPAVVDETEIGGFGTDQLTTTGAHRLEISTRCAWRLDVTNG